MSDMDILIRKEFGIPEGQDTIDFLTRHGYDYTSVVHFIIIKNTEG